MTTQSAVKPGDTVTVVVRRGRAWWFAPGVGELPSHETAGWDDPSDRTVEVIVGSDEWHSNQGAIDWVETHALWAEQARWGPHDTHDDRQGDVKSPSRQVVKLASFKPAKKRVRPVRDEVLRAWDDPKLFGGVFAGDSWRPWRTVIKAAYGLDLGESELDLFTQCTGRTEPDPNGYPEVVVIVGRRAGKSRVATAIATLEAVVAKQATDEHALLVSQDHRASMRVLLSYCKGYFQTVPALAPVVAGNPELPGDSITLTNGCSVSAYPCRPQSVRGLTARVAVLDEISWYISSEGFPRDREMLNAVRPALATTRGKLFVLSSPYGQTGALYDLHRTHWAKEDSPVLIWQASAPVMNPTLPKDYLDRMAQDDPDAYRSEVLGEFRAGVGTLLDPDAIEACVGDYRERPPQPGTVYAGFVDVSGGRGDDFTVAIGHVADNGTAIVDCVRYWAPPFDPKAVTRECAAVLASYGVRAPRSDRYSAEWSRTAFADVGIDLLQASVAKSEMYVGSLLPTVNAGQVLLPDLERLLRQLRLLERRTGRNKDVADHPRGGHDDLANAVAGLVHQLTAEEREEPGYASWLG